MKNYYKFAVLLIILFAAGIAALAAATAKTSDYSANEQDVVLLNEIAQTVGQHPDEPDVISGMGSGSDFIILDTQGNTVYDTRSNGEHITVETAIKKRYPYKYIISDGHITGSVILIDDGMKGFYRIRTGLIAGAVICAVIIAAGMLIFGVYIEKNIVKPFRNMQDFAGRVAEGDLSKPLTMDSGNMFGAFSESFDIMREELLRSRERELSLQKKERELVASLSHDLKTPITGIKLTTELLKARYSMNGDSPDTVQKLDNIYKKASEIDTLVTDLFSSTLEELGEFRIVCRDENSAVIGDIIRKYDDKALVIPASIPQVLINVDARRLSQVIGNIISNSYKYAGTNIDVSYRVIEGFLEMSIQDHGPGVPESEINLITNKFYRGSGAGNTEGSGLGLYIARMLMEKMDGELLLSSDGDGLRITLLIPLS